MPIHGIGVRGFLLGIFRCQVNHQLMAEEVEIAPVITGATFLQAAPPIIAPAKVMLYWLVTPIKWPEKVSGLSFVTGV
jgi:hypothetical protein